MTLCAKNIMTHQAELVIVVQLCVRCPRKPPLLLLYLVQPPQHHDACANRSTRRKAQSHPHCLNERNLSLAGGPLAHAFW